VTKDCAVHRPSELPTEGLGENHGAYSPRRPIPSCSGCRFSALAVFVGYFVVWGPVTPALHTPLMSGANAISSVIVVGALRAEVAGWSVAAAAGRAGFGFIALLFASVNIFASSLVTPSAAGDVQEEPK